MGRLSYRFLWFYCLLVVSWWAGRRRRDDLARVPMQIWEQVASSHLAAARDIFIYLPPGFDPRADRRPICCSSMMGRSTRRGGCAKRLAKLVRAPSSWRRRWWRRSAVGARPAAGVWHGRRPQRAKSRPRSRPLRPLHHDGTAADAARERLEIQPLPGADSDLRRLARRPLRFRHRLESSGSVRRRRCLLRLLLVAGRRTMNRRSRRGRRIAHQMVRQTSDSRAFRGWFQAGTLDETSDRDNNGVIDAIQDTQELIAEIRAASFARKQISSLPGSGRRTASITRPGRRCCRNFCAGRFPAGRA
jgi:hypothetical protein